MQATRASAERTWPGRGRRSRAFGIAIPGTDAVRFLLDNRPLRRLRLGVRLECMLPDSILTNPGRSHYPFAGPVLEAGYRGFDARQQTALLIGDPDEVSDEIGAYRALGCNHFLLRHVVRDQAQVLSSIRLIGEKVIPRFV